MNRFHEATKNVGAVVVLNAKDFWNAFSDSARKDIARFRANQTRRATRLLIAIGGVVVALFIYESIAPHHDNKQLQQAIGPISSSSPKSVSNTGAQPLDLFNETPPPFIFVPEVQGAKPNSQAWQTAGRFAWLDALSGPTVNTKDVLTQIQQITTQSEFQSISSAFSLPTDPQTWLDIKVYPGSRSNVFRTVGEVEDSSGNVVQLSLTETLIEEGGAWKVQSVTQ